MKKLILILVLLLPGSVLGAGLGQSAGHDLDALWARAQKHYDLSLEDAVLLLESRQIAFTHDGSLQTRVHRVVWIGTAVGIRGYADLRVPWNSATSTLDVEILRTWRHDPGQAAGRWWPDPERISDTAVVHTLPYAVDKADDYTDMRETMLLHDGVELGCIMETAYTITERGVPARGGLFMLPRRDPVVVCELRVMAPPGMEIQHAELNGAPAAESINPTKGQGLLWRAENVAALKLPVTASPEAYEPAVAWSTWTDWEALSADWNGWFERAVELNPEQSADFVDSLSPVLGDKQKLAAVGDYLNEMTREVHYPAGFWRGHPRPAARVLETAFGHDLDRAVLAAALIRTAGLTCQPMLIGSGAYWPVVAGDAPSLQGLERVVLVVPETGGLLLDPADGKVKGFDEVFGHPFYRIGTAGGSGVHPHGLSQPGLDFSAGLTLQAAEDGDWQADGFFRGRGVFSQVGRIRAGDDLLAGPLSELAGSLLPGGELTAASPITLDPAGVFAATFAATVPAPTEDAQGRIPLVLGRPAGGLLDKLPHEVHLYDESRQTPVMGVGGWEQTITVSIEVAEDRLLQAPAPVSLTNQAGSFHLTSEHKDGWLILTRTLQLVDGPDGDIPADLWPDLRALLLEEADPVHGMILLE